MIGTLSLRFMAKEHRQDLSCIESFERYPRKRPVFFEVVVQCP